MQELLSAIRFRQAAHPLPRLPRRQQPKLGTELFAYNVREFLSSELHLDRRAVFRDRITLLFPLYARPPTAWVVELQTCESRTPMELLREPQIGWARPNEDTVRVYTSQVRQTGHTKTTHRFERACTFCEQKNEGCTSTSAQFVRTQLQHLAHVFVYASALALTERFY